MVYKTEQERWYLGNYYKKHWTQKEVKEAQNKIKEANLRAIK